MSTPVLITLIICGTLLLLSLISGITSIAAAKKADKTLRKISEDLFKEDF